MIMADVLMWTLLIATLMVIVICYWLISEALFPKLVRRASGAYSRPIKTTLIGLVVSIPIVLVAIIVVENFGGHPVANIVAFLLILVPVLTGLAGSAGFAHRIGTGLPSSADEDQPWRRVLRGGTVMAFACLLPPFFGLPWAMVSGFGAWLLVFRKRAEQLSHPVSLRDDFPDEKEESEAIA